MFQFSFQILLSCTHKHANFGEFLGSKNLSAAGVVHYYWYYWYSIYFSKELFFISGTSKLQDYPFVKIILILYCVLMISAKK